MENLLIPTTKTVDELRGWLQTTLNRMVVAINNRKFEGTIDANQHRIVNVANPSNPGDAVPLGYLKATLKQITSPPQTRTTDTTPTVNVVYSGTAVALSTAAQDLPNTSISLTKSGRYLIHGCFDMYGQGSGDSNVVLVGQLVVDSIASSTFAIFTPVITGGASNRGTVFQQWTTTVTIPSITIKLQAYKTGGTGTSTCDSQSSISVIWLGP